MKQENIKNLLFAILCAFVIGGAIKSHLDDIRAERVWGQRLDKILDTTEERTTRLDAFLDDWESKRLTQED